MTPLPAREVLRQLLDAGSFRPLDAAPDHTGASPGYRGELAAAAAKAGTDEAVVTGEGTIGGRRAVVIVSEFRFLGGSVGLATAQRIRAAVGYATRAGLPLVASTATGGTRMQEGTRAFAEMTAITRAIVAHRAAGLLYVTHLRHPTTGGVLASWGSLGQLTLAEPGALIGFIGPKVYERLAGEPFPPGIQVAENLYGHGLVDAVLTTGEVREVLALVLGHLGDPVRPAVYARRPPEPGPAGVTAWDRVTRTREPGFLSSTDVLAECTEVVRLGGASGGIVLVLARADGVSAVVLGQDRRAAPLGPADFRLARRGIRLARELALPLVTLIDTPGADLSPQSENDGQAQEIARCIAAMVPLTTPSVSVLVGQGAGGGALALFPAARSIALPAAWLAPLPPEGASVIAFGDTDHAPLLAETQGISAPALLRDGLLSAIVPQRPDDTTRTLARALLAEVRAQLTAQFPDHRSVPE